MKNPHQQESADKSDVPAPEQQHAISSAPDTRDIRAAASDLMQKRPEDLVQEIVSSAQREFKNIDGEKQWQWILTRGKKELDMQVWYSEKRGYYYAKTRIGNTYGTRTPGDTTLIYMAVRSILQTFADKKGLPVLYSFTTMYSQMGAWAREKGTQIFGWNEDYWEDGYGGDFSVLFKPKATERPSEQHS